MTKTLGEIAALVGGRLAGDAAIEIRGATNIEDARASDITFAVEPHLKEAGKCAAGAVILPDTAGVFPKPAVYVKEPRAAFACLLEAFTPPLDFPPGISDLAYIGAGVQLGVGVTVMPFAVVDAHAVIGDGVILYPHTYVGQYAEIGAESVLYSSVTVRERCRLGRRCVIHSSTVIGADGFGFTTSKSARMWESTGRQPDLPLLVAEQRWTTWSISDITAGSGRTISSSLRRESPARRS